MAGPDNNKSMRKFYLDWQVTLLKHQVAPYCTLITYGVKLYLKYVAQTETKIWLIITIHCSPKYILDSWKDTINQIESLALVNNGQVSNLPRVWIASSNSRAEYGGRPKQIHPHPMQLYASTHSSEKTVKEYDTLLWEACSVKLIHKIWIDTFQLHTQKSYR